MKSKTKVKVFNQIFLEKKVLFGIPLPQSSTFSLKPHKNIMSQFELSFY